MKATTRISRAGWRTRVKSKRLSGLRRHTCLREDSRANSFTLIELMLVLVIMAIFAGMIMPAMFRALKGASLRTTGNKLCELLDFAYASAVSHRRPVLVNIDPERRRCWVSLRSISLPWLAEEKPLG